LTLGRVYGDERQLLTRHHHRRMRPEMITLDEQHRLIGRNDGGRDLGLRPVSVSVIFGASRQAQTDDN
jgi:hypothetical protein